VVKAAGRWLLLSVIFVVVLAKDKT